MSKLVVNQIQYSGGATYTLPTSNPTANDQLKTDGSGALGWSGHLTSVKNSSSNQVTNMPTQAGSSGQTLQSNGSGTLTYGSPPSNPMKVGSTYGYYLADRYEVLSGGNTQNFVLSAGGSGQPGSATPFGTSGNFPIGYYMQWIGLGTNTATNNRIQAWNQAGNDVSHGGYNMNVYYLGTYNSGSQMGNSMTSYKEYVNVNYTGMQTQYGNSTLQFTDSGTTTQYGKVSTGEMWIFPGKSYPQFNHWVNYSNTGNNGYNTSYCHMWTQNMMQGTGQGYEYFTDVPWQFEWQNPGGAQFNEGVAELYILSQDNGTYPG